MQKNVGTVDALLRITFGLAGLAYCAAQSRDRFPLCMAIISAMKVAEGITRFCPVLAVFGVKSNVYSNK
ncbi:MAG: DUF2892 domain-containing protein [Thermoactinomyces sp.]